MSTVDSTFKFAALSSLGILLLSILTKTQNSSIAILFLFFVLIGATLESLSEKPLDAAVSGGAKLGGFIKDLYAPKSFKFLSCLILFLGVLGFAPSIVICARDGAWYANSVLTPKAWGKDSPSMIVHVACAGVLVVLFMWQVASLGPRLLRVNAVRKLHPRVGYFLLLVSFFFFVEAHLVIVTHGVAGKIIYNLVATVVGFLMMYHAYFTLTKARAHDRVGHLEHSFLFMLWFLFPGILRLGTISYQYFVLPTSCDIFNTSGIVTLGCFFVETLHRLLRWSAMGTPYYKSSSNTRLLIILCLIDFCIGVLDNSFLQCPVHPLLQQVDGVPFSLIPR